MRINTLYLPGFSHRLCGRRSEKAAGELIKSSFKLDGLAELVARYVPMGLFEGVDQRRRIYPGWVCFCAFFGQVLNRGASCRDAVRRVQAWYLAIGARVSVDSGTGGYSQARKRLGLESLHRVFECLGQYCQSHSSAQSWQGRTVKVVDACGLSMPDTKANRARFAYAPGQKEGCGFPTGKFAGLFSLATGHLVRFATCSWEAGDALLARQLIGWVQPGEVVLADRGFCSWLLIALFKRKGVDVVMRLHHRRKAAVGSSVWSKPQRQGKWDKALWEELPEQLNVRVVRFKIEVPGFRTECIEVVTTLLDEEAYPDSAIADLFRRRWQVEINLRDIKTTLGLDVLRTQTPEMIDKEIYLQAIAYNLVRALMLDAARADPVRPARLSFKGTISALRAFAPLFAASRQKAAQNFETLLLVIAADPVPDRPDRVEPRAVKRRSKSYPRLNRPRHLMRVKRFRRAKQTIEPLN